MVTRDDFTHRHDQYEEDGVAGQEQGHGDVVEQVWSHGEAYQRTRGHGERVVECVATKRPLSGA